MVQILPAGKTFGSQFGQQLGSGITQGVSKSLEFQQKMHLEKMKKKEEEGDFSQFFKSNEMQGQNGTNSELADLTDMQKMVMAEKFPKAFEVYKEKIEKQQDLKGTLDTINWLDENSRYSGKFGLPPKWGGIEAQGESGGLALKDAEGNQLSNAEIKGIREEFDSSGIWAADKVYTHFNKGVLNKEKWEDIKTKFAPNSELPSYINKARTAALRRIMGLAPNSSPAAVNTIIERESKALEKIEKSKGNIKGNSSGKVMMKAPNGEDVPMDANMVQEAISRGWKKL